MHAGERTTVEVPSARSLPRLQLAGWLVLFILFIVCATLNAGGYRYGVSDQAFYIPAIRHHLDSGLFPRDWALLGPQDRLNLFTRGAAGVARAAGVGLPALFLALYLAGLATMFAAVVGLGRRLYRSAWTAVLLVFAVSFRHAVALGAVNTLEGYTHPRVLAFAAGSLAMAACLASRPARAALLAVLALALHPTTGIWFALWLAVALAVSDRRFRIPALLVATLAAAAGAWALAAGPLTGRLVRMDEAWLAVLASKTYLFPTSWPASAWLVAAVYPLAIAALYRLRRKRGLLARGETGLVAGAGVLLGVFLASLPLSAARVGIAVQLQVPRVLWLLDLLALVYVAWFLAEGAPWARSGSRAARGVALAVAVLAASRGAYVTFVEHRGRAVVQVGLPDGDWTRTMGWVSARTPKDAFLLAPPYHAWRYGTSARVAAERDVFLEEAKDTAMALYSRPAAMTVIERIRRASAFDQLTAESARALAAETGVSLLVTERRLDLPLLHVDGRFAVYQLR